MKTKFYNISAWSAVVGSLALIINSAVSAATTPSIDVTTILVANLFPVLLFYSGVCLVKIREKSTVTSVASVLVFIDVIIWIISLLSGSAIIVAVSIFLHLLLMSAILLLINWYIGKVAGIIITIIVLFIGLIMIAAYGRSILHSSDDGLTSYTNNGKEVSKSPALR
jgi:hypothetical protein